MNNEEQYPLELYSQPSDEFIEEAKKAGYIYKRVIVGSDVKYWYRKNFGCNCR